MLKKIVQRYKNKFLKKELIVPQDYQQELRKYGNNGLFSTSYEAIKAAIKENASDNSLFYLKVKSWRLKDVVRARYDNQKSFIESHFIPLLKKSDSLLDIGCAEGEWTCLMSPYVHRIVAYDYSANLIQTAKINAKAFTNITFLQGDICQIEIKETYDCLSLMGVLSYILDWEQAEYILSKLYAVLRGGGGIMIYKDNTNPTCEDYYFFQKPDYWMVTRSRDKYRTLFEKIGFKIVEEKIIDEALIHLDDEEKVTHSYICILKKEEN